MKYLNKISAIVATMALIVGLSFSASLAQSTDSTTNQPKKYTLSGKVVSAQSGQVIPNAKVMIFSSVNGQTSKEPLKTTMTDIKGKFKIKKIPEGTYLVKVKVKGDNYKTWTQKKTIKKDTKLTIKLKSKLKSSDS